MITFEVLTGMTPTGMIGVHTCVEGTTWREFLNINKFQNVSMKDDMICGDMDDGFMGLYHLLANDVKLVHPDDIIIDSAEYQFE